MLTLKKVKEMVKAPAHTKRVPSPKVLLEEGRIFLRKEFEHGSIGMILAGLGGFEAFLALLDGSYAQAAASALVALLLCPFAAPMLLSLAGSALIVTAAALFAWLF